MESSQAEAAPTPRPEPAPDPGPSLLRRLMRRLVWLGPLGLLPVLLGLLIAGAAGLWWWSGQEGSLRSTLQWWSPAGLSAEGVSGSLREGGRAEHVRWQQAGPGWDIEAEQLQLRWDLTQLLTQWARASQQAQPLVQLPLLSAHRLRIRPPGHATSSKPPESVALPVAMSIDQIRITELRWQGGSPLTVHEVDARYQYLAQQHDLQLRHLRLAQGSYAGQLSVQDHGALQARMQGQWQAKLSKGRSMNLELQASASGTLERIELQAELASSAAAQAELQALIAGWQSQPVVQAHASFAQLDLAWLWPGAPSTRLSGKLHVQPQDEIWRFAAQLNNADSGPIDQGRLPLDSLNVEGRWQAGQWLLESTTGQLGRARLRAQATVTEGASGWQGQAEFEDLQPAQVDSRWPTQTLQGKAQARLSAQTLHFGLQVLGRNQPRTTAWTVQQAQAQGQWSQGQLTLDSLSVSSGDARLEGSGRWHAASQSGGGQVQLKAPGLELQAQASWPLDQQAGQLQARSTDPQAALRWLRTLPGLPADASERLGQLQVRGRSDLRLQWTAGLREAQIQSRSTLASLSWGAGAQARTLRDIALEVQGPLDAAAVKAQLHVPDGTRRWRAQGQGQAMLTELLRGAAADPSWRGRIEQLQLELEDPATGRWQADNLAPLTLQGRAAQWQIEPGRLRLQGPARAGAEPVELAWSQLNGPLSGQGGSQGGSQWASSGTLSGLPLAWLAVLAGPTLTRSPWSGDLVFDGRWDLRLGRSLALDARLSRRSGDLQLQGELAQGQATTLAAGVKTAELQLSAQGQELKADIRWDSERAGRAEGQLRTRLEREGEQWHWPETATLQGQLQAQLPRLGLWSAMAPPGWRLRGSMAARLQIGGSRAQPQFSGQLQADDLALRSVVDGIELGRGRLRARLDGQELLIDELSLRGSGEDGGAIMARGLMQWPAGKPRLEVQAQIDRLRASVRSDRLLTVSGQLKAVMAGLPNQQPVDVSGALHIDQARISLPEEDRPQLGSDVRVRRAGPAITAAPPAPSSQAPPLVKLGLSLDLGSDFLLQGRGLSTRLQGQLMVSGQDLRIPQVQGQVSSVQGQFKAYGQNLNIERGLLRFSGPIDNPALDVLALRPNLTQKVGVQVSGSALLPRISLYADPDLPEGEKLAWLVLGRAASAGGTEAALLQQAALGLIGKRDAQNRPSLANALGLDEITLRGAATQADGSSSSAGLGLGKRLSSNVYALYESGLGGALGTLFLFYDLSQKLTLRAQAGAQTALDLIYKLSFD